MQTVKDCFLKDNEEEQLYHVFEFWNISWYFNINKQIYKYPRITAILESITILNQKLIYSDDIKIVS